MKWRRKISGPISKEVWTLLPKKLTLNSQKYGFGIRDPEKKPIPDPDPGVKKAPDPQHCYGLINYRL
jgi:hypothetical protein